MRGLRELCGDGSGFAADFRQEDPGGITVSLSEIRMPEAVTALLQALRSRTGFVRVVVETECAGMEELFLQCGFRQIRADRWCFHRPAEVSCRLLAETELNVELFSAFHRYQNVTRCWRRENGAAVLKNIAFTEEWSPEDYSFLVKCLRNTVATGGAVAGAFQNGTLIGFASLENTRLGSCGQYLQLSSLHVSAEFRGRGIGRMLFSRMAEEGRNRNAEKLYISSHSAEETQAFYRSIGCVEAEEIQEELLAHEPCDCMLEYAL